MIERNSFSYKCISGPANKISSSCVYSKRKILSWRADIEHRKSLIYFIRAWSLTVNEIWYIGVAKWAEIPYLRKLAEENIFIEHVNLWFAYQQLWITLACQIQKLVWWNGRNITSFILFFGQCRDQMEANNHGNIMSYCLLSSIIHWNMLHFNCL